jgi:hypothetical protein
MTTTIAEPTGVKHRVVTREECSPAAASIIDLKFPLIGHHPLGDPEVLVGTLHPLAGGYEVQGCRGLAAIG